MKRSLSASEMREYGMLDDPEIPSLPGIRVVAVVVVVVFLFLFQWESYFNGMNRSDHNIRCMGCTEQRMTVLQSLDDENHNTKW